MKHDKIICIKIAQRKLSRYKSYCNDGTEPEFDFFPFDRVYLARKDVLPSFKRIFRYYMSMPVSPDLLKALAQIRVDKERELPIIRDDSRMEYRTLNKLNAFEKHIRHHKNWFMVVPTHVRSKYKSGKKDQIPYASEVSYILTRAVNKDHNQRGILPQITLHTPTKVVPVLCGLCKNQASYLAGDCNPGQASCAREHEVLVALDNFHSKTKEESLKASGGDV